MKTDKDALTHAILLKVMGGPNVAKLAPIETTQRANLRRAKEEPIVETLRTATDTPVWASERKDMGNLMWTSSFTSNNGSRRAQPRTDFGQF